MTRLLSHRLASRLVHRVGLFCFTLALATGALACDDDGGAEADDETTGDEDGDPLSYTADIQPIWDTNCLTACHEADGVAFSTLDLSGDSYDNVVNAAALQAPGLNLIEPGSAAESYLVAKLRGTQVEAGGLGDTMPSGAGALSQATIATIEEWIDAGAMP
jgi:hypothetical protein